MIIVGLWWLLTMDTLEGYDSAIEQNPFPISNFVPRISNIVEMFSSWENNDYQWRLKLTIYKKHFTAFMWDNNKRT